MIINFQKVITKSLEKIVNEKKTFKGNQIGIYNLILNYINGTQIGIKNQAEPGGNQFSVEGKQIGLYNKTNSIKGNQVGLINECVNESEGTQLGIANGSRKIEGKQFGLFNLSWKYLIGNQFGIFNATDIMNGVQIGIINVAIEGNYRQFGLINYSLNKDSNKKKVRLFYLKNRQH